MGPMGRQGAHAEPTLVLRAGRDRSLRRRHPWIFAGAVADVAGAPEPGDVVAVRSATGELLARASFEPGSGILARVWAFGDPDGAVPAVDDELVVGAPRGGGDAPARRSTPARTRSAGSTPRATCCPAWWSTATGRWPCAT